VLTDDAATAQRFLDDALRSGHEGVMVKAVGSTYEAGRRGRSWRKVKPVRTLDLVVVGVEWGSGRRRGWLSNLHLAARDPGAAGDSGAGAVTGDFVTAPGFVTVGKTVQGPHRRPPDLADRAAAWPVPWATTATSWSSVPSSWSRSRSTACSGRPATPAVSRSASPGSGATAPTGRRRRRHHRRRAGDAGRHADDPA
jgi:hypothetical protein